MDVEKLVPEAGNLTNFIEQFEVLSRAPDGVEKIRSLIYQLAVKGKLVAHSAEETASDYLDLLKSEREILVSLKKSKKTKLDIVNIIAPFPLPECWEWVYLDLISQDIHYGYTASANQDIKDVRLLRITDIQNNKVSWNSVPGCLIDDKQYLSNSLEVGDLLIARTGGTVGKSYLVANISVKAVFASYLIRVKPLKSTWRKYLKLFTLSPLYWEQLIDKTSGSAQPNVNATSLKSMLVPIPPLEEQKRIVAKVDELMALCDKLEAQQQQQANNVLRANSSAINALLNPGTPETSFEQNWQRIAQHFNTLYGCTLPMPNGEGRKKKHLVGLENVKALRLAILNLATTGKLSFTTHEDEPVSILESRIKNHQQDRIKKKEIKRPKQTNSGNDSTLIVKSGWALKTINEISFVTKLAGFEYSKYINLQDTGEVPVVRAQNVKPFKFKKDKLKYIDFETSKLLFRCSLDRPALLVTFIGAGIGDVCIFNEKQRWHLAPNVAKIELYADINIDFICYYLNSSLGRKELFKSMKSTAQPSLSMTTIREIFIPLPPLQEQKSIVAKVDQLMTLCDQLEQQLTQSYSKAEELMQATVKALVA